MICVMIRTMIIIMNKDKAKGKDKDKGNDKDTAKDKDMG